MRWRGGRRSDNVEDYRGRSSTVEGFCIPGDNWEYDVNGNPIVNSDTSECPLPVVGHDCLVFLVLYNRAMQMMDANGMAIFNKEYLERLGQLESYAATYARRTV